MIRQRDLIVIMICFAALIAVMWFWIYYQPALGRISELERSILHRAESLHLAEEGAKRRILKYADINERYSAVREEWEVMAASLPYKFEDTEVLRSVQNVVYPHVRNLNLSFSGQSQRPDDGLWSTGINLSFATSYWQLLAILDKLVDGEMGNRVVNYSLSLNHGETDFRGLQMLNVSMEIEYLSLEV
ncbi:MAG: hypothetical protein FWF81_08685 [Defluviitaleaceae bacterium]|nr:hypothetical protein [Defluviitaleaceae bacterium]